MSTSSSSQLPPTKNVQNKSWDGKSCTNPTLIVILQAYVKQDKNVKFFRHKSARERSRFNIPRKAQGKMRTVEILLHYVKCKFCS